MMIKNNTRAIIETEFTSQDFEAFLLETIFTEVFYCEVSPDPLQSSRLLMTALGKLQDQWYLVQISSQDRSFENLRIIQLPQSLLKQIRELL